MQTNIRKHTIVVTCYLVGFSCVYMRNPPVQEIASIGKGRSRRLRQASTQTHTQLNIKYILPILKICNQTVESVALARSELTSGHPWQRHTSHLKRPASFMSPGLVQQGNVRREFILAPTSVQPSIRGEGLLP